MTNPPRPVSLALGGFIALVIAMGIGRFVYTPILPFMLEDLGWSEGRAGLIASANYAGYLLGALFAAMPNLRGSRRGWLLAGLITSALTTAATGMLTNMPGFYTIRFIAGFASAVVLVFASTLVLERLRSTGHRGFSALHFAGPGAGIALSAVLISGLVALDYGWRGQWIIIGVICLLASGFVIWLVPNQAEPAHSQPNGKINRAIIALVLSYGLYGFGYVITATFLVVIVRASPQVQSLEPIIWFIVGITSAVSIIVWNWIGGKIGIIQAFSLACIVEAIGVGASVLWITPSGIILAASLLGGTFVAIAALGLVAARELTGGDPRSILGIMTAAFGLGQIIGPAYAGLLFDQTGSFLPSSLTGCAALIVSALLCMIFINIEKLNHKSDA